MYCVDGQEVKLARDSREKLGISVQGGVGSRCGNPFDSTDEGIFISQVSINRSFVLCGQVSSLLWTPALRPYSSPVRLPRERKGIGRCV